MKYLVFTLGLTILARTAYTADAQNKKLNTANRNIASEQYEDYEAHSGIICKSESSFDRAFKKLNFELLDEKKDRYLEGPSTLFNGNVHKARIKLIGSRSVLASAPSMMESNGVYTVCVTITGR